MTHRTKCRRSAKRYKSSSFNRESCGRLTSFCHRTAVRMQVVGECARLARAMRIDEPESSWRSYVHRIRFRFGLHSHADIRAAFAFSVHSPHQSRLVCQLSDFARRTIFNSNENYINDEGLHRIPLNSFSFAERVHIKFHSNFLGAIISI